MHRLQTSSGAIFFYEPFRVRLSFFLSISRKLRSKCTTKLLKVLANPFFLSSKYLIQYSLPINHLSENNFHFQNTLRAVEFMSFYQLPISIFSGTGKYNLSAEFH